MGLAEILANLEQFNTQADLSILQVAMALALAALFSYLLGKLYVKYGTALSNRKRFASNFVLLAVTTTLIILIVKSSLALSLGLVGALSIVRFRAAVKEPEELVFLFLNISMGLGFGANQWLITIISFIIIAVIISARHFVHRKEESQNLYLTVAGKVSNDLNLKSITDVMKKHCNEVQVKRFDEVDGIIETSLLIDFDSFEKLQDIKNDLSKLSKSIRITYLDKN